MKQLIVILSGCLISFLVQAECRFSSSRKIYSLSGPVTVALKDMNLLQAPELAGISVFHPVKKEHFKGELISGGTQLSPRLLFKMKDAIVFYDQSLELKKIFKNLDLKTIEIISRNLSPLEVNKLVIQKLEKYLVGCESKKVSFLKSGNEIAGEILSLVPINFHAVFFLGALKKNKFPDHVMVNDGVVKWLLENKKMTSYPSPLAYIPWSMKLLNNLPKKTLYMGVEDTSKKFSYQVEKLDHRRLNLYFPGALVPGKAQLEAWLYLFKKLKEHKELLDV